MADADVFNARNFLDPPKGSTIVSLEIFINNIRAYTINGIVIPLFGVVSDYVLFTQDWRPNVLYLSDFTTGQQNITCYNVTSFDRPPAVDEFVNLCKNLIYEKFKPLIMLNDVKTVRADIRFNEGKGWKTDDVNPVEMIPFLTNNPLSDEYKLTHQNRAEKLVLMCTQCNEALCDILLEGVVV
jgi:hypothetical protein